MSTSEGTLAVEGIGSGEQGNIQTQGESNTCQAEAQRETEENRLPETQSIDDEENQVPSHVEMWRERKGRTPTGGRSQSTSEQGNGTVSHIEMWKERQGGTTDEGQRERTRETEHHVRMWEMRHTLKGSEQEAKAGQQLSCLGRMRSERAMQIEENQSGQEDTGIIGEHVRIWERRHTVRLPSI